MKMFKVLLVVLSLCCGYAMPALSAASDSVAAAEIKKDVPHRVRHHRGMSGAMMKDLDLNDAQKKQWKELATQKKAEIAPLREQMKKLHEQERQINEKYEAKVKAILNKEQADKYETMLMHKPHHKDRPPFGKRKMPGMQK